MSSESGPGDDEEFRNISFRVISEFCNLSLLNDSYRAVIETNWYNIARTTFHIGFIGLLFWSLYMFIAWSITTLIDSTSIIGISSNIATVGPLFPIVIFIFAIFSNHTAESLEKIYDTKEDDSEEIIPLFIVSTFALTVSGVYRWAIYSGLHQTFGNSLSELQVISTMIVDGLYINLLLIGIGGFGSILFEPNEK